MAVAHDASSESHTGTTGSASEASFSWTHTPSGTPAGTLVFTHVTNSSNDNATAVTYGGTAMTAVSGGRAAVASAEPGDTVTWFLGSSVPTGAQSVVVTRTNNADVMYATCATVTAATNTEVYEAGIQKVELVTSWVEKSVDDDSPGQNSVRYAGAYAGGSDVVPVGANSTALESIDFGGRTCALVRETTAGQGARSVGWASATADDNASVYLAVREAGASDATPPMTATPVSVSLPQVVRSGGASRVSGLVASVLFPQVTVSVDWVQKLQPVFVMSVFPIPAAGATGDGANEMMMMGLGV